MFRAFLNLDSRVDASSLSLIPAVLILLAGAMMPARAANHSVVIKPTGFAVSARLGDLPADPQPASADFLENPQAGKTIKGGLNFNGVSDGNYAYPDSNGAVGATQYMQWTNTRYAIYDKTTGQKVAGPTAVSALWEPLGGVCSTSNPGEGIIIYDKAAGRWVITHHAGAAVPLTQCVAVSTTSDATGTYNLYAFVLNSTYYPDYNQLAVWPDAYYLSVNLLTAAGYNNVAAEVCALDRTNMLAGNPASTAQCLITTTNAGYSVLQPSDLDGLTPPPTGSPNYLLGLNTVTAPSSLDLYKFHVDWVTPANTILTGPVNIAVNGGYTLGCYGGYCVPQLGTSVVLDGVGDRLLHRFAYRNFGAYESLVITHAVNVGNTVGVRWYEIRSPGTTPVVYQEATWSPDSNYRWVGSAAMDQAGNMLLGYSVSSASMYPAIRYAGRLVTDPLNTLEAELTILNGTYFQDTPPSNWGNATSMSVDPIDDCTFFYTNEYFKPNSLNQSGYTAWYTRIASFKFSTCP